MEEEYNFEDYAEQYKPKKHNEVKDIVIAWLVISLCFTIVLSGYHLFSSQLKEFTIINFLIFLGVSLIVTGTSFILHELAHKYTAIRFGAKAKFVKWKNSLLFSIGLSFLVGFVFVAPGAVYIYGKRLSVKEEGITSLAGPVINIIMGFVFFGLAFLGLPAIIITYGIFINFWIALFNLIPIGPLDGKSIFLWNPIIWLVTIAIPVLFLFVL
ncbi:MAG: site-2 protease family protein [archaeon]|jgi:Zn-dependent protease|nr:site-2 protease family protein [archaeon]MDD2477828.1 site-2 protease family protein [Candidatus ainarchaeum sp.]MDD3084660.1 site-2 protease family protein [Candidatus ainarchaeum sp.]MDD4221206.1 site-2 protease family protein [Candidatus ainarchaeum sp.]MDD4662713.1 site-2 protease family protein [Candidatus ainarchaeum sp.]